MTRFNPETEPHFPYIEAVVDALNAAGLTVTDWHADANDPLDAAVELDRELTAALYGETSEVWLCWTEERGWYLALSDERDNGNLSGLTDLLVGVVPGPDEMVALVRDLLEKRPARFELGRYRDAGDDDDVADELLAYLSDALERAASAAESARAAQDGGGVDYQCQAEWIGEAGAWTDCSCPECMERKAGDREADIAAQDGGGLPIDVMHASADGPGVQAYDRYDPDGSDYDPFGGGSDA